MRLDEVLELRALYETAYRAIAIAGAGKRGRAKRKPRFNEKDKPVLRAVIRDMTSRP
jgi:hypothetical protein